MTLYFARAMAPEVRVNAVCPGLITSRWFVDGVGQEGYERLKAMYEGNAPLGRACTPEDVADAVLWLVDGARRVTGELLLLDGGVHLGSLEPNLATPLDHELPVANVRWKSGGIDLARPFDCASI